MRLRIHLLGKKFHYLRIISYLCLRIPFNGTYVYNPQNGEITLKTSTETLKGNVMRTQNGMGLMFDANQMVNLLQKEGKVSNPNAVQAVSNLAKSANGARVGFELTK